MNKDEDEVVVVTDEAVVVKIEVIVGGVGKIVGAAGLVGGKVVVVVVGSVGLAVGTVGGNCELTFKPEVKKIKHKITDCVLIFLRKLSDFLRLQFYLYKKFNLVYQFNFIETIYYQSYTSSSFLLVKAR